MRIFISEGNYDLFAMRRLSIQMDSYISQFPDSPFALSLSAFYYMIKYQMLDNDSDIDIALQNCFKSHEILKKSIFKVNDPLLKYANDINFRFITVCCHIQGKTKLNRRILMLVVVY